MEFINHVSRQSGFTPGPSAFVNAPQQPSGTLVLDTNHLRKIQPWSTEFETLGVQGGVQRMLQMYFAENVREGASDSTGPIVTREQFNSKVIVPLLVTHTGLLMTTKQQGALKALTTLVSVLHVPESLPMKRCEFVLRFKTCGQMLAQRGNMSSDIGGVSTSFKDLNLSMEKFCTGFTVGDQELFLENDPGEITKVLAEKLQTIDTTWGLTALHLHAQYAARQPTMAQVMLMNSMMHQPDTNLMAKMMQIFSHEHLLTGALNRSEGNFGLIMSSLATLIRSTDGFAVLVPQRITDNGRIPATRTTLRHDKKVYVYNANKPSGLEAYSLYGTTNNNPFDDAAAVGDRGATAVAKRYQRNEVTDVGPEAVSSGVEVDEFSLSNGSKCYNITIDGTPFDSSPEAMTCDEPLVTRGVKKLFFTVGGCPDVYDNFCNPGFFSASSDSGVSPRAVAETNPGVTYFVDYDTESVAKITLEDIHQMVASDELFDAGKAHQAWLRGHVPEHVGYINEQKTAELLLAKKSDKIKSPRMMFEKNPRFMWIRTPVNLADSTKVAFTGSFAYYVPRTALGNSSPCSEFHNEMVGCVGSLMHQVRDTVPGLVELLDFMSTEIRKVSVPDVVAFRALTGATVAQIMTALQAVVSDNGILSDPLCQLVFVGIMKKALDQSLGTDTAAATHAAELVLVQYVKTNMTSLFKQYNLIMTAIKDVSALISTVYQDPRFNLLLGATGPIVNVVDPSGKHGLYLRFMYGMVMPALTGDVMVDDAQPGIGPGNSGESHVGNILQGAGHLALGALPANAVFVLNEVAPAGKKLVAPYGASVDRVCVARPLFHTRCAELRKQFAGCPLVKVLALVHYWTAWNKDTMIRHFDKLYYSGQSYLVVRHMSFRGHSAVALPFGGTRFLTGNRAAAFPLTSWQATKYTQTMEMALAPMNVGDLGVACHNVYIDKISGLGEIFDINNPSCALIFDSYNNFLPQGLTTYQPEMGMVSVHGRYDGASRGDKHTVDAVGGIFTQLPTSDFKTSPIFAQVKERLGNNFSERSSVGMMDAALRVDSFAASVPAHVLNAINKGVNVSDVLSQTVGVARGAPTIFTPHFGGMFADDYTVGFGSEQVLRGNDPKMAINTELQPRIASVGGITANAVFGQTDADPKFMQAFLKQVELCKGSMWRSF